MKRKLIKQMSNEWRSNLWMTVELVIVGAVLWVVFSLFAGLAWLHQSPKGIDFENICVAQIGTIPEDASTYQPYADSLHNEDTDLEMIMLKIKSNPCVEMAGTGSNAIPYNRNYSGNQLSAHIADSVQYYMGNIRNMSPDLIRTFRLTGVNGESTESLAKLVEEGQYLISTNERSYFDSTPEKWVGKDAWIGSDSSRVVHIGALINGIRRTDYEPVFGGVLVRDIPSDWMPQDVAIRVKPGMQQKFMESLTADDMEFGNVYIYNLMTIEQRRDAAHHDVSIIVRNLTACALFVMIAVFLGFLGSFWYRTQQRVPELALRKVNGATNADLFRRFISEGLLLLAVSAPFIIGFIALILTQVDLEDALIPMPMWLVWAMLPLTLLILAMMICGGIWLPARKAMKINPAEALKDQ